MDRRNSGLSTFGNLSIFLKHIWSKSKHKKNIALNVSSILESLWQDTLES